MSVCHTPRAKADPAKPFYVYAHQRTDVGGAFYIGKGIRSRAWDTGQRNVWWVRVATRNAGFHVNVFDAFATNAEALSAEVEVIALLRDMGVKICNITAGGEGTTGLKPSAETTAKRSASLRALVRSPEVLAKLSASLRSRNSDPVARAKVTAGRRAQASTPEGKAVNFALWAAKKATPEWQAKAAIAAEVQAEKLKLKAQTESAEGLARRRAARGLAPLDVPTPMSAAERKGILLASMQTPEWKESHARGVTARYESKDGKAHLKRIQAARMTPVMCLDNGQIFESVKAAQIYYSAKGLGNCLNGLSKTFCGLRWARYEGVQVHPPLPENSGVF